MMEELFNDIIFDHKHKKIIAKDKTYQMIPDGGEDGDMLIWDGEKAVWGLPEEDAIEKYTYGVSWAPGQTDPHCTRIGDKEFHRRLPIQNGMRGCVFDCIKGHVVYWLDHDNWNYKEDGTPSRLDGYDGEVMVYIPEFWIKSWETELENIVRISVKYIDSTWEHQPECYISAYKNTVLNRIPEDMGYLSKLPINSAISVMNDNTYCRGGLNNSTFDQYINTDPCRSLLNKPRTYITSTNFRNYSRLGNKEVLSYNQYKNILYWLYVIEYANFNCQEEFNHDLDDNGFKQGGLGIGVTTINMVHWNAYFNGARYNPLTPCGYCNEIGNNTGLKKMELVAPEKTGSTPSVSYNFNVPRWRGIDNPFGDTFTHIEGILLDPDIDSHDSGMYYVYACTDPNYYGDSINDGYKKIAESIPKVGLIEEFDLGSSANIIPKSIASTSFNTCKCDYVNVMNSNKNLRGINCGGYGYAINNCGLAFMDSYFNANDCADAYVAYHTIYVPSYKH